ncbi:hypothetical protein BH20CHL6_BH20CHL6_02540 [soil metagenome]
MLNQLRVRWENLRLRAKALLVVGIPVLALLIVTTSAYLAQRQQADAEREAERSLEISRSIQELLTLLVDAETGVRGFLLTGDGEWLAPHEAAVRRLPGALDGLAALIAEPVQQERLQRVRSLIERRRVTWDELRAVRGASLGSESVQGPLARGKVIQDELRDVMGDMQQTQGELDLQRIARAEELRARTELTILAGGALGLLGGLATALLLTGGIVRRLERLSRDAGRLEQGLMPHGRSTATDEIGDLGRALERSHRELRQREAALREARESLEQLITAGPVMMVRLSPPRGGTTYASPNIERLLGYRIADILGTERWWNEHIHAEDREQIRVRLERLVEARGSELDIRCRLIHADGSVRWIDWVVRLSYDSAGNAFELTAYGSDVTERLTAQQLLEEREATLSAILTTSPDLIAIVDEAAEFRYASPAVEAVLGIAPTAAAGRSLLDHVHADDRIELQSMLQAASSESGMADGARFRLRRGSNSWVWTEARARTIPHHGQGAPREVVLVARDASAQVALEAELREARAAAESANFAKSEFLSRMSHELRTPLNAVLGFGQLLEMDDLTPDQQDSTRYILKAGRHLLELIEEVLDISRIETGRLPISPEPVAVGETIDELVALLGPMASPRRIAVESAGAQACSYHVMADRQRLKQVLLNLITNAIKYNREGGRVRLFCTVVEHDRLRICVEDTGPGFTRAQAERLFTPFDRLGAEQSGVEGTGIGLVLSRRLVEAMGGVLAFETRPGEGSTFWAELAIAGVRIDVGPDRQNQPSAAEDASGAPSRSYTILAIEDNAASLMLIERVLARRPGLKIESAIQGSLGLDLARQLRPDLILLDLHLPDMAGMEVLQRLRAEPPLRAVPVVILSADATAGQRERLIAAGAHDYLAKPIDIARFLSLLEEVLPA